MRESNIILQRERKKKMTRRKAIGNRINELTAWLSENKASDSAWDVNVRELHAYELKLEMMNQSVRKANCVDYGVSLTHSVQLQY